MFPLYYCTLASWPVTEKLTPQILGEFFFFQSLDNSTLSEGGLKPMTAIETFFLSLSSQRFLFRLSRNGGALRDIQKTKMTTTTTKATAKRVHSSTKLEQRTLYIISHRKENHHSQMSILTLNTRLMFPSLSYTFSCDTYRSKSA